MSTPEIVNVACVTVACIVILVRCEPAMNRLSCNSSAPKLLFASFLLLAISAIWQLLEVLAEKIPSGPASMMFIGAACLLMCERRVRVLCHLRVKKGHRHGRATVVN